MVIKVYISGISGNHEIRKHQQRVLFILSSLKIDFEIIDITEIGKEEAREFMRNQCKLHKKENPLPPQIFNNDDYCGDYEDFETANEDNELMFFLKLKNKLSSEDSDEEKKEEENQVCNIYLLNNVETGENEALIA